MPAVVEHLWHWFHDLSLTRGGGFGPSPISWQEIYYWSAVTGNPLAKWEIDIIRKFDSEWLKYQAEKTAAKK